MKILSSRNISRYPESEALSHALEGSFTLLQASWIAVWSSGARLRAMSHTGVLAAPQASTSPNKICQADKQLISLLHSSCGPSSSPGRGRNAELGLELLSAQVRMSSRGKRGSAALLAWDTSAFASCFLLFGVEPALCLQAAPKVPFISSHLCSLIPAEGSLLLP